MPGQRQQHHLKCLINGQGRFEGEPGEGSDQHDRQRRMRVAANVLARGGKAETLAQLRGILISVFARKPGPR
jgi:hypothetical protein